MSIDSSEITMTIGWLLRAAAKRHGFRVFDSSLGYKVFPDDPERFRKPDVTAIRQSRAGKLKGNDGFARIPADLAVEVVSPGDDAYEIAKKVEEYLSAGFGMVWIVYPNTRTVHVHRQGQRGVILSANDELDASDVLDGFKCRVGEIFDV